MNKTLWRYLFGISMLLSCGEEPPLSIDPKTDEFVLEPSDLADIEKAANEGDGAEAQYSYDESDNTLTVTITASSFQCGIETGTLVAKITELSSTTMKWEFEDDGGDVTWSRVDQGTTGVIGVFTTDEPPLHLIVSQDGSAQIFGQGEECAPNRGRNAQNCLQTFVSTESIAIDGDLSDWESVGIRASLSDETDDHLGDDSGADLTFLRTAFSGESVYVLMQLASAPSTQFQNSPPNNGAYRFTINGYNGLSFQAHVYYDPGAQSWTDGGYGAEEVTFAVGPDGIEWKVDISRFMGEGFNGIDLIMVEPMDYSNNNRFDEMDCAWFNLP